MNCRQTWKMKIKTGPLYRALCIVGREVSRTTLLPEREDDVLLQREVSKGVAIHP